MNPGRCERGGRKIFSGQITGNQDNRMRVWPWRAGKEDGDRAMLTLVHGEGLRDLGNSPGPWC